MHNSVKPWMVRAHIDTEDAINIARELIERVMGDYKVRGLALLNTCRDIIALGSAQLKKQRHTVTFEHAALVSITERAGRKKRTVDELRCIYNRLVANNSQLAKMGMRAISTEDCRAALATSFRTPGQFRKGRAILHSFFACAQRHGWCDTNPVSGIMSPIIREKEVAPLSWDKLTQLLDTARRAEHRDCMPALGLLLWAGVRPAELERLSWENIDWEEGVISLRPKHSKTGGARHITLHTVLREWISSSHPVPPARGAICPKGWIRRWKALRRAAGITEWQQDVLRHTFASYHLKYWHDPVRLQEEMGHRSAQLLRTRYLSMDGVTAENAKIFWDYMRRKPTPIRGVS